MAQAHKLTVRGADGEYPVVIGPGALDTALPDFVAQGEFSRVAVVTNTHLAPLYGVELAGQQRRAPPLGAFPSGARRPEGQCTAGS